MLSALGINDDSGGFVLHRFELFFAKKLDFSENEVLLVCLFLSNIVEVRGVEPLS